jgi:hypothetical protein
MMPPVSIQSPGGYAASRAVAFADPDGAAVMVSAANPLPVAFGLPDAAALAGSATSSVIAGPYEPVPGRAVMLELSGTWSGTARVLRSVDAGASMRALTAGGAPWAVFSANCCEPVWEESETGAQLYLDIALASGTLAYRFAQ